MPLVKSGSKKAFSENVKKEVGTGKPQKQAVAIAYAQQRKVGGTRGILSASAKVGEK
jgi:hypothetical protein